MAVTITSEPPALNASRRYIRITATSDRLASTAYTGVVLAESPVHAGFCRYTTSGAHVYKVGDVITPTAFSPASNVRQTITYINEGGTNFVTNLAWNAATMTDLNGTATRTNDNFKLRCRVYVDAVLVATHFKQAVSSVFTFYIEKSVDAKITYTLPTTVTMLSPCVGQYKDFYIILDEYYDNESGLSTLCTDAAVTSSIYAAIKASRTDIQAMSIFDVYDMSHASGGSFLTNMPNDYSVRIYDREIFPLAFFSSSITDITVHYTQYNAAMGTVATGSSAQTLTGKYGIIDVTNLIAATTYFLDVYLKRTSTGATISRTMKFAVDWKRYNKRTGIIFQNRMGGLDRFDFLYDFETFQEENKFEIKKKLDYGYTSSSRSKETVFSEPVQSIQMKSHFVSYNTAIWLKELKSSKQVFLYASGDAIMPLNNIEMEIPAVYDNSQLIQTEFKADLYNIV